MKRFHVNEDIQSAFTLDSEFYISAEAFEQAKEKIFTCTWQFLGNSDEIQLNDQITPYTLWPGLIDEPIIVTRNNKGEVQCLSNVCTHRGNILVEHKCQDKNIRCPYHGRRFDLNGTFQHMPEFEAALDFPSDKDNLPKVPYGSWEKLSFAGLLPSMTLQEVLGDMQDRISFLPFHAFKLEPTRSRDYQVNAHWALYTENYLEGFHIPFVHADLNAEIDYGTYTTELFRYSNLQLALSKGGEDVFEIPEGHPDFGKSVSAYYFWIFPNMMFNFYPWGLSLNIIRPLGISLTEVSFITYVYDENKLDRGAGAQLDKVELEDEVIVENVQKGIRSRFYDQGRYSPTRETGIHHFHRLICEFMNKEIQV